MNSNANTVRAILLDASECDRPETDHPATIEISADDLQRILERHITEPAQCLHQIAEPAAAPLGAQGLNAKDCDMFWVADDPDQNHDTLHDAVVRAYEDGGLQTDSTVEIQCAKCIGNVVARITSTDPLAFELLIDAELTAQADQGTEMKVSVE